MYRNWSARIPSGPSVGQYISGTSRVGWLGADITAATAAGVYGAGIFINDQIDPIKRYRALLENSTFANGALILKERGNGSFTSSGTAVFGIFEDSIRLGSTTFTGTIPLSSNVAVTLVGAVASAAVGAITARVSASRTITGVSSSGLSGTITASGVRGVIQTLTGVAANSAVGTLQIVCSARITLLGVSAIGFVQPLSPLITISSIGQATNKVRTVKVNLLALNIKVLDNPSLARVNY
jgi:hypothetical protein